MRLQVIDPTVNFDCKGCTRCCDQPWHTLIEPEKLAALDGVDWAAAFPDMAGKTLYRKSKRGAQTVYELGKGEGTRCVFLDADGLCRIHKKLGYEAKPAMCRQFPFFAARAWDADYVSANYGCKAVQERAGRPLSQQAEEVRATVPLHETPVKPDAPFLLAAGVQVPPDAARALLEYLGKIVDGGWIGSGSGLAAPPDSLAPRLAAMLAVVEQAAQIEPARLRAALEAGEFAPTVAPERYAPFASATHAPMPCRFLFAATLFPDTLPPDSPATLGFFRRLTLVPRLMSLTRMRGGYASRLLKRNIRVDELLDRAADVPLTPDAAALLGRYLRSRLWQRFPGGTRLPLLSAVHQHILDLNAVVFYGLAEMRDAAKTCLDLPTVQRALMHVEFHLANQRRLYEHTLKGWLRQALATPALAWASLRMLRCAAERAVVVS